MDENRNKLDEQEDNNKKVKKKIDLNDLFLGLLTLALAVCYFLAYWTYLLDAYIIDLGEIDLELIGWETYNLSRTYSEVILTGGMFFLGLLYLISAGTKKKKQEEIRVYIEDPDKNTAQKQVKNTEKPEIETQKTSENKKIQK